MKKLFASTLLITLCFYAAKAQSTLANYGGPIVDGINTTVSGDILLSSNEDEFTVYYSPIAPGKKYKHSIVTYDKANNTLRTQDLTFTDDYFRLAAFDAGDYYFMAYSHYPKNSVYEYVTANVPKSSKETAVTPRVRLTLEVDRKGESFEYAAKSPNGQRYAVAFFATDKKSNASNLHLFLYDETGEELFYKSIIPQIYGNSFSMEDFQVTNEGEILILICSGDNTKKTGNSAIQLFACSADDNVSLGKVFPEGRINNMKICQLRNGNYLIGGYYAETADSPSKGYFTTIAEVNSEEFGDISTNKFTASEQAPSRDLLFVQAPFRTHVKLLRELEDGSIFMLGEHTCMVMQSDGYGITYWNYCNNVVYQHFDKDGIKLHSNLLKKQQRHGGKHPATDFGVNVYSLYSVGLSVCPMVAGNDVYILYNDNYDNFKQNNGQAEMNIVLKRNKTCQVLAKLEDDGPDRSLVMLPDKDKKVLHKVWFFDGKTVYYGMSGNKQYTIEHFDIED